MAGVNGTGVKVDEAIRVRVDGVRGGGAVVVENSRLRLSILKRGGTSLDPLGAPPKQVTKSLASLLSYHLAISRELDHRRC